MLTAPIPIPVATKVALPDAPRGGLSGLRETVDVPAGFPSQLRRYL